MTSTATHMLPPDVHAVALNGDLVFLDVVRDSYVCLPDGESQARLSEDRRRVSIPDCELAEDLARAGLIAPNARPESGLRPSDDAPPLATASRTALCDHYDRPDVQDGLAIAASQLDLLRTYRGRPFHAILAAVRRPPETPPPRLTADLIATARDFHRWAPYAPTSAKCLLRSFMLLRLLRRRGLDALWVFGVRTWPFHAHCWLQCEDMVLDDQPDRIRAFTPILVA